MSAAIVLLSGGLDSAVALWWARAHVGPPVSLTFNYDRRPLHERRAAVRLCELAGTELIEVPMPFLKGIGDLQPEETANRDLRAAPVIYLPARNLIFYSIAAYFAEIRRITRVIGGHVRTDAGEFPDAAEAFFYGLNRLFPLAIRTFRQHAVEIQQPLLAMNKEEVLRLGVTLGVPFDATWSCYWDDPAPCGRCPACRNREVAFQRIGLADPHCTADA